MAHDDKTPVTFILPDGDNVALVTWSYISDKLSGVIDPLATSISLINQSLTAIDTKLDDWIKKDNS